MKKLCAIVCLLSASLAYADIGAQNAYLTEEATIFQPGGSTSYGDTFMHAWGQSSPGSSVYVDFATENDGSGWNSSCSSSYNISLHYFTVSGTTLSSPTKVNCMTSFGTAGNTGNWTTDNGTYTWKSAGVLAVNGVLYWAVERQQDTGSFYAYAPTIMMSTNGGASWCDASFTDCSSGSNNGAPPADETGEFCRTASACSFTSNRSNCGGATYYDNCTPKFAYIQFVQYEKDATGAMMVDGQDSYIYAMALDYQRANFYLMRFDRTLLTSGGNPSNAIQTATNWEYYSGAVGGSITTSGNWTTWNSGTASGCTGSSDPACGATVVLSTAYTNGSDESIDNSNTGPIYVSSDFGYLICQGYLTRICYTSTSLTGESGQSSTGNWTPQIFAPHDVIPVGWSGGARPFLDDFPEPILATMALNGSGSTATATLTISSSGDFSNGSTETAMYTATLTLYKQNQTYQATNLTRCPSSPATGLPASNLQYETYTTDAEWSSYGPATGPYNIATAGSVPLPADLIWTEYGLGFSKYASSDVFTTPYNDSTGDFTLFVVYNRSDDYSGNPSASYERIVDKTSDAYGGDDGFTIQRNGTAASQWCFYIGYGEYPSESGVGGCDTTTTDFPDGRDGSGNPYFNLIAMEKKSASGTSTLTVWNSKTGTNSYGMPINQWSGTLSTPTANTYLRVGNSEGLTTPFTGTIFALVYYNTALSSTDAATATTAVEDAVYCSSRFSTAVLNNMDITSNN